MLTDADDLSESMRQYYSLRRAGGTQHITYAMHRDTTRRYLLSILLHIVHIAASSFSSITTIYRHRSTNLDDYLLPLRLAGCALGCYSTSYSLLQVRVRVLKTADPRIVYEYRTGTHPGHLAIPGTSTVRASTAAVPYRTGVRERAGPE